jgi:hypothetical protein
MSEKLRNLFDTLQKRVRPEDIAELVAVLLKTGLTAKETKSLQKATSDSLKSWWNNFTSMSQDFRRPVPPIRQVKKSAELFINAGKLSDDDCADVEKVSELVTKISNEIFKNKGENSFTNSRLNNKARKLKGLEISRRRYNKLFRFLANFEKKIETYKLEIRKYEATRIAKSSLATSISYEDFSDSVDAACFVAYFTARSNRRSVFTNKSQDKPFDEVAEMLLSRFKKNPTVKGWRAISFVMPDAEIVRNLSNEDKLELLTRWLNVLNDIADLLKITWGKSKFNRETMIVKRGDDSSTWNSLAGAWNSARQGYISVLYALGMENLLKDVCFGKVMRLMAADVAAWHRLTGGKLEPDTLVWAELPPPWEVFSGEKSCPMQIVEAICKKHEIDPIKKNWTFPKQNRQAVSFQPTPELVHGVIVSNPHLAQVLRKADWFSGKNAKEIKLEQEVLIERDSLGFAAKVSDWISSKFRNEK